MIHPTAVVDAGAELDDGVEVGPYAIVGDQVRIGGGTRILSHAVIEGPTTIGRDNHIHPFCVIGGEPQDKKFAGESTALVLGDGNTIREGCTISRGTVQDGGTTTLGDDNWIMAYVHIAHDCHVGSHTIFSNNATLAGHVHVGDWAIFAGFSGAQQFCRVGAHSFLGAYSGTNRNVPAYVMVAGLPSEPRGINSEGLRRRGFSAQQISNIKQAYRLVYRQGLKLAEAIREIEALVAEQPELEMFLASLQDAGRGLLR